MPGHSYKGSSVPSAKNWSVLAAVVSDAGGGEIMWLFNGTNPPNWSLDSLNAGVWEQDDIVPGTDRDNGTDFGAGQTVSVVPCDSAGNYIGVRSNAVLLA